VQVKYEMLRQVRVENHPLSQSAKAFGFSRPSFYQARSTFQQTGMAGPDSTEARPPARPQADLRGAGSFSSKLE